MVNNSTQPMSKVMWFAMWILLIALLTYFFNNWYQQQYNPNQALTVQHNLAGKAEAVLERNRFGHYIVSGLINRQPVVFIVDTGATDISIPAHIAKKLGLKRGPAQRYQTANGTVMGYVTILESVAIGGIEQRNIRASINPGSRDSEVLLGMSFLKNLEMVQRGNKLTLKQ